MKSTLALKSTVTRRPPATDPAHLAELQHHQATAAAEAVEAVEAVEVMILADPAKPDRVKPDTEKPPKRYDPHALQTVFLTANLNRVVTVFLTNGVRLVGRLQQFDQYCVLLETPDGVNALVFKHAISTIMPTSR